MNEMMRPSDVPVELTFHPTLRNDLSLFRGQPFIF